MDTELVLAYVILALSLVALYFGWLVWRLVDTSGASPPRPAAARWPRSLQWMVALTVGTACLLGVQVLLGISIGALALLADSAHGAADFASYMLASFVEYFKFRFGADAITARASAQLDQASAGFSVLIVMATSICVCAEAARSLRAAEPQGPKDGLGSAMLVVAALGMALNGSLLALKMWMGSRPSSPDAAPNAPLPEGPPAPLPEDVPQDAPARDRRAPRKGSGARVPRVSTPGGGSDMRLSLHDAFHPGCRNGQCAIPGCGAEHNLNEYGVVLHVATDVARTFLMVIAGALLKAGVFKNSAYVDAVCAWMIAGCVTLGSVWMLGIACRSVEQPSANLKGFSAKGEVSYGAA
jgi:Co/Zn/Cd efflux system component